MACFVDGASLFIYIKTERKGQYRACLFIDINNIYIYIQFWLSVSGMLNCLLQHVLSVCMNHVYMCANERERNLERQ